MFILRAGGRRRARGRSITWSITFTSGTHIDINKSIYNRTTKIWKTKIGIYYIAYTTYNTFDTYLAINMWNIFNIF